MKAILSVTVCLLLVGAAIFAASESRPTTVIHVINVKWKVDATPDQIKAAVEAAHQLPAKYPGIKRVWTKNIKYQAPGEGFKQAIVMEFASEDALKKYTGSEAQKEWYKLYLPVRDESRTADITN